MKKYKVAVVGATGAVGQVMLKILAQRNFPVDTLYPLASSRSAGNKIQFKEEQVEIIDLDGFNFSQVDIALFSAGGSISEKYAPTAAQAGAIVIDNTSAFRYQEDIPLIVPEVNIDKLAEYKNHNIIANPNCSTIQMLVALAPIHKHLNITRINVATYQAVSGSGQSAIDELNQQSKKIVEKQQIIPEDIQVYPQQIAFNAIPHIDVFKDNGYTKEEMKMVWETQKILDSNILVNPTCVRIPVLYGHSEAVHIEVEKDFEISQINDWLSEAPGITLENDIDNLKYPTAVNHAAGKDDVYVGRLRRDISHPLGINLWIVADNIRKGAALNSVQIAEALIEQAFI